MGTYNFQQSKAREIKTTSVEISFTDGSNRKFYISEELEKHIMNGEKVEIVFSHPHRSRSECFMATIGCN